MESINRCEWAGSDPLYLSYHDEEWGVPVHDDHKLFEMLILEGAQAGLSWLTVLRRREGYRTVFEQFDPVKVAQYDERKIQSLLNDSRIIRNRLKIRSTFQNAQAFLDIQKSFGSFDKYIWQFVDGQPRQNDWKNLTELPPSTDQSDAMSRDLKKRGFSFVGSTICYAFMQATGMVNDHVTNCFRYDKLEQLPISSIICFHGAVESIVGMV